MSDYIKIAEENFDDFKKTLANLIAIPSVAKYAEGSAPFGKGVNDALEFTLKMAEKDGFKVKNVDNYGGHIDFPAVSKDSEVTSSKGDDTVIAVVGHLDVVPAGDLENWNTDPFKLIEKDGKLYGRGVLDDKGPLLASYFALKALKESGFKPSKTIRIILGCDEETDWMGMTYYMQQVKPKVIAGFSPDADFPAIHAEKGCAQFKLERKVSGFPTSGFHLAEMTGGTVANAVADKTVACLKWIDGGKDSEDLSFDASEKKIFEKAKDFSPHISEAHDLSKVSLVDKFITVEEDLEKKSILLTAHGVSAHSSRPDLGINAISVMMEFLETINLPYVVTNDLIRFYNSHIGHSCNGENIGIGFADDPSGKLSLNVGIVDINEKKATYVIDVRYPVTLDFEDIYDGLQSYVVPLEYRVEKIANMAPLYKAADDPLIETLMNSYKEFTGDLESKPIVIGGATYARAVPNTVAFGPVMPGREDICHQPNEYIYTEDLENSIKIFARAMYELAK